MRATIDILKCLHLKRQDAEVVVGGIDTIIEKGKKEKRCILGRNSSFVVMQTTFKYQIRQTASSLVDEASRVKGLIQTAGVMSSDDAFKVSLFYCT